MADICYLGSTGISEGLAFELHWDFGRGFLRSYFLKICILPVLVLASVVLNLKKGSVFNKLCARIW